MKERNCLNCMYSDDWDNYNVGICYYNQFTAITRSVGVCRHHRYDEDDKGDKDLLFIPQISN